MLQELITDVRAIGDIILNGGDRSDIRIGSVQQDGRSVTVRCWARVESIGAWCRCELSFWKGDDGSYTLTRASATRR